ncbi:MAG: 4-alpha-glucanotransferase [Eubacteriales bacterium]|nr:4-alpha-glucanotransferase [Eubacteriales bacterium]
MSRAAGMILPITSLPSRYGVGCFSRSAYDFVDWLREAGQTIWQILPIGPTSFGDSPYQSYSTFAGNPYFISLEALIEEGVLTQEECDAADLGDDPTDIAYDKLYYNRFPLLRKAYERSDISKNEAYQRFLAENGWWLADYALFMAVKEFFGGQCWYDWPEDIRRHWGFALDYYREKLYFDIEFHMYMQFKFFEQYQALKEYANDRDILIMGDIPIYVSMDSADVWAHPELFQLDEDSRPVFIAGCPPDAFSDIGQLWGNPVYNWDYHRQTGYDWWITRLAHCSRLFDLTRIDHFRGFDEYFAIPYGAETAAVGHWEQGPGLDLFRAAEERIGECGLVAEDLGFLTETVREMLKGSGFPGMKVLQFAFDVEDTGFENEYLPHDFPNNCIAYTGTHDNDTLAGWIASMDKETRKLARDYACDQYTPLKNLPKVFIALMMRSNADTCIIPIQDYLGLGSAARINTPSTVGCNWRWRLTEEQLSESLQEEVAVMTRRYGRMNAAVLLEEKEAAEEAARKAAEEAALAEAEEAEEEEDE